MAIEAVMSRMRQALAEIKLRIDEYAASRGWKSAEVNARVNPDWGRIQLIVVFPEVVENERALLLHHLQRTLQESLYRALSLTVLSAAQVEEGGLYAIAPDFERIEA